MLFRSNSPSPVLSGGRYDSLAKKIRGEGGALGFALYLDGLNLYYPNKNEFDCDVLIIANQSDANLFKILADFENTGKKVMIAHKNELNIKAKQIMYYDNGNLTKE